MEGEKFDSGKRRYSLVPRLAHNQVVDVLDYGANKYSPDNWRKVPDLQPRYYDALMRHVDAFRGGEQRDPETGLHHLAHASCCLYFILEDDLLSEEAANGN